MKIVYRLTYVFVFECATPKTLSNRADGRIHLCLLCACLQQSAVWSVCC